LASITALVIQFIIWKAKLKKKIPKLNTIRIELLCTIRAICHLDRNLVSYDANFALSRNFNNILPESIH
jgi:hypothetical protein